ncbi:hypothetical protein [Parafrankia sp. EUN1f]|uniref:hypothetical protein n=1 Tax=Parafrankia sp. EUN1f TaxID=102897 RepID=UPI0001C44ABD|nr:hypothetical protein [Parafrankia sp. EUN1f]EFC83767.1 hypothetical protein FrEUN1fDRAFT_3127 [Parafrankia sp. EUN1f]
MSTVRADRRSVERQAPAGRTIIISDSGVTSTSVTYTLGFESGLTHYRWRVYAANAGGSTPSATRAFTSYEPG